MGVCAGAPSGRARLLSRISRYSYRDSGFKVSRFGLSVPETRNTELVIDITDERRYRVSDSAALAVRSEEARPMSDRV